MERTQDGSNRAINAADGGEGPNDAGGEQANADGEREERTVCHMQTLHAGYSSTREEEGERANALNEQTEQSVRSDNLVFVFFPSVKHHGGAGYKFGLAGSYAGTKITDRRREY